MVLLLAESSVQSQLSPEECCSVPAWGGGGGGTYIEKRASRLAALPVTSRRAGGFVNGRESVTELTARIINETGFSCVSKHTYLNEVYIFVLI